MGKYEEALERAKAGKPLDEVFPELKESEDERIRKALLRCCDDWDKGQFGCMEKEDIPSIRAYLERQKEQPMSAEEVLIRAGLKPYRDGNQWCVLAGGNIQEGICGFGDTIDEALYQFLMEVLKIKKEQQPAEVNVKALLTADRLASAEITGRLKERTEILENPEKYGLCKPAEWSEEDERMLSRCAKSVECSKEFCDTETFKDAKDVEKDWLKSLPERFKLQPKQEWSEEDEEIWKEIFGLCNRFGYDDACRKLRFLRPQPHWKPGDEQMEALRAAMEHNVCYCGCNHHALKSLYNDLRKLL